MEIERKYGRCHICGNEGELTFEHIPPRKAFNNTGILMAKFENYELPIPGVVPKNAFTYQKGMGTYSLCEKCNNDTGGWYGTRFVSFAKKGMLVYENAKNKTRFEFVLSIYPLSVIKQIISMFLSINSIEFRDQNTDLSNFVLNPEKRHLDPKYRFFIYYLNGGMYRTTPLAVKMDLAKHDLSYRGTSVYSEISYPPFGYLLAIDSQPFDKRLFEITHFVHFRYDEIRAMEMNYSFLPTHTIFPGDYRSLEEIKNDANENSEFIPS